jgi:hypothetical protein
MDLLEEFASSVWELSREWLLSPEELERPVVIGRPTFALCCLDIGPQVTLCSDFTCSCCLYIPRPSCQRPCVRIVRKVKGFEIVACRDSVIGGIESNLWRSYTL